MMRYRTVVTLSESEQSAHSHAPASYQHRYATIPYSKTSYQNEDSYQTQDSYHNQIAYHNQDSYYNARESYQYPAQSGYSQQGTYGHPQQYYQRHPQETYAYSQPIYEHHQETYGQQQPAYGSEKVHPGGGYPLQYSGRTQDHPQQYNGPHPGTVGYPQAQYPDQAMRNSYDYPPRESYGQPQEYTKPHPESNGQDARVYTLSNGFNDIDLSEQKVEYVSARQQMEPCNAAKKSVTKSVENNIKKVEYSITPKGRDRKQEEDLLQFNNNNNNTDAAITVSESPEPGIANGHSFPTSVSNGGENAPTPPPPPPPKPPSPKPLLSVSLNGRRSKSPQAKSPKPKSPLPPVENGHEEDGPQEQNTFYMSEQQTNGDGADRKSGMDENGGPPGGLDAHPLFVCGRDVRKPDTLREFKIVSAKGTVRGFKNRVRAGIATFLDTDKSKTEMNYRSLESGKLVLYTTSMRIVRETYEKCMRTKNILQTHMVEYEERDVFMSRENQRELTERLGTEEINVPQVFADGLHLAGSEQIESMNEDGELRRIFKHFKKVTRITSCEKCGGFRYIPCTTCHGSKKSVHRNHFTEEFCALRCIACDENGLIRCDLCHSNDQPDSPK